MFRPAAEADLLIIIRHSYLNAFGLLALIGIKYG